MKTILTGIFITLLLLTGLSHAGIITVCDTNGDCRQIITPTPYGQPDEGVNGGIYIDVGNV